MHAIQWNTMQYQCNTKGIQSYLRIWGCYDPIESSPSKTKKRGLYGCSVKKSDFRAKNGPLHPPRSLPSNMRNTKTFWCLVIMVTKKLEDLQKKIISGRKHHFWAQKGPFWANGAMKRPAERPNGHLPENRSYPELPQDVGVLWSHWVGSVWPQKMGIVWV